MCDRFKEEGGGGGGGSLFTPLYPWATPKRPILNKVNIGFWKSSFICCVFHLSIFSLKMIIQFFVSVLHKICFKVKVLKTIKISSDRQIKTCRSLKRRAIWKSLVTFLRRTYFCWLQNETLKTKRFPVFTNVLCANKQSITFKNNTTFLKPFIFLSF